MSRKKLDSFQVLSVKTMDPNADYRIQYALRQVDISRVKDGDNAPPGCFAVGDGSIFFPKRSRGQKFSVTYTQICEKEM